MRGHLVVLAALGTTAAFSPPAVSGSAAGELGLRRPAQGCGISMVKDAKNGPFGPVGDVQDISNFCGRVAYMSMHAAYAGDELLPMRASSASVCRSSKGRNKCSGSRRSP